MYLVMAVGGYYAYFFYGLVPLLPNPYLSEIHKYISMPCMAFCYYCYYKASFTNPGYLRNDTDKKELERAVKRYACDRIIFSSSAWCSTDDIPKPARSKHCSLCNACVEKYDHHCVWINACVGLHNYKWFIMFLLSHTLICIYGVIVGYYCCNHLIDQDDLWNKTFTTPQGHRYKADMWIIISYLQYEHEAFTIAVFLCCIVTVMLLGFLGFHTYLIMYDYTTNETVKRRGVSGFIEQKLSFMKKWEQARIDKKPFKPSAKSISKYEVRGDIEQDSTLEVITQVREKSEQ